jgi:hypothetical protein
MVGIISQQGFIFDSTWLPYNISGSVVVADIGKAVSQDTAHANTMKLAADGDRICGRLETLEARTVEGTVVGTVSRRFSEAFPILGGETFVVGDTMVGGGGGLVRVRKVSTVVTPDPTMNTVFEVLTDGRPVAQNF